MEAIKNIAVYKERYKILICVKHKDPVNPQGIDRHFGRYGMKS